MSALYDRPPSFTDYLPWMEYLPESRSFLLEDGVSVGALFELTPVGTEARTPGFMTALRDAIQTAITEAIPECSDAPWILQLYVQDDPSLSDLLREVETYLPPQASSSAYTREYLELLKAHCARISRPGWPVRGHRADRHDLAGAGAPRARGALPAAESPGPDAKCPGSRGRTH